MSVRDRLSEQQREALWKWRWLGWRDSTPAFKVSLIILGLAGVAMAIVATR